MQRRLAITRAIVLMAFATMPAVVFAQLSGGPYQVNPATIASGGGALGGGPFRLSGTLGQPATALLSASGYRVYNGFWAPASPPGDAIFANGFDP